MKKILSDGKFYYFRLIDMKKIFSSLFIFDHVTKCKMSIKNEKSKNYKNHSFVPMMCIKPNKMKNYID